MHVKAGTLNLSFCGWTVKEMFWFLILKKRIKMQMQRASAWNTWSLCITVRPSITAESNWNIICCKRKSLSQVSMILVVCHVVEKGFPSLQEITQVEKLQMAKIRLYWSSQQRRSTSWSSNNLIWNFQSYTFTSNLFNQWALGYLPFLFRLPQLFNHPSGFSLIVACRQVLCFFKRPFRDHSSRKCT